MVIVVCILEVINTYDGQCHLIIYTLISLKCPHIKIRKKGIKLLRSFKVLLTNVCSGFDG